MKIDYDAANDEHSLVIQNTIEGDFGEYSIKATNTKGEAKCKFSVTMATSVVMETTTEEETTKATTSQPTIEMELEPVTATAGDTIKLTCKVKGIHHNVHFHCAPCAGWSRVDCCIRNCIHLSSFGNVSACVEYSISRSRPTLMADSNRDTEQFC